MSDGSELAEDSSPLLSALVPSRYCLVLRNSRPSVTNLNQKPNAKNNLEWDQTRSEMKESVKPKVECYADESRQENVLLAGRHVCVTAA